MFRFKQFSVDQRGCAMKINTDGVLLGAIADADDPASILDIGTGTGVIALMLAQKFANAKVDAVELDADAARTAERNFRDSPFAERLTLFPLSFEDYFEQFPGRKYDLIISNPPFYIDSLKSPGAKKTLAKHTDIDFFERLIGDVSRHLLLVGCCWLVLPVTLMDAVISCAQENHLYLNRSIFVRSYKESNPHRVILKLSFSDTGPQKSDLLIYERKDVYSGEYKKLLQPYFIAF